MHLIWLDISDMCRAFSHYSQWEKLPFSFLELLTLATMTTDDSKKYIQTSQENLITKCYVISKKKKKEKNVI